MNDLDLRFGFKYEAKIIKTNQLLTEKRINCLFWMNSAVAVSNLTSAAVHWLCDGTGPQRSSKKTFFKLFFPGMYGEKKFMVSDV